MRVSRALLCMALLALLCVSVMGFNPYADEDDQVQGETPKTSTIECKKDPATGEEKCESITKIVPDEEELERKMEQVEREREELAAKRAEAKRIRDEKYAEEREAKRQAKDKKRKEREEADAEKKKKGPSQDDYKIKAPLKKLRMDYYKFFGVERDAPKLKVRKAANQLAAENHPDKCPTAACRDKMVVLNAARDVLLNDETRDEYDFLLRFGFKIYDKELYEDIKKAFEEDPDNVPDGFDEDFYDPTTDPYESMALTEESAGWLLLITGSITLAMLAWPIIKFWEKSQTAEAKKAALKKEMLASQAKGLENLGSMKKKTEKYVGDRTVKRFNDAATSPRGPTTPSAAAVRSPSNKATAAVALVCILGFLSLLSTPVTAATFGSPKEISLNYYELLEVASGVETSALKRAYRSAALKWHPDRFVDRPSEQEEASAKFILIAEGQLQGNKN